MASLFRMTHERADAMSTMLTAPAIGATWFNLSRHDEDPADPAAGADDAPEVDESDDDAEAEDLLTDAVSDSDDEDDADAKGLGAAGKKALDRMKAERTAARREADAAKKAAAATRKQLADLQKKVDAFEDRDKSDLEKAQAQAERAQTQAAKAVSRAVSAEVRSLAVGQFADAADAVDVLMRDPSKYIDSDGDIDTDLIEADLADLLERKPHWAKPEAAPTTPPAAPKPKAKADPGQGSRGTPPAVDFRTASDEDFEAELKRLGVRRRR